MKANRNHIAFFAILTIAVAALLIAHPGSTETAFGGLALASVAAFTSEGSYSADDLLAGSSDLLLSRNVNIPSGHAAMVRGAVLGKVTVGTASGAAAAGNTGGATIGSVSTGNATKPGVYKAVVVEPATDAGQLAVFDPDGVFIRKASVGVAFTIGPNFTVSDSGTDLVAGDSFNITVAEGTGDYKLSLAAATDGSQVPDAILAHDVDASGGAKVSVAHFRGDFNDNALTLGAGHTVASIREGLRVKGINLITPAAKA